MATMTRSTLIQISALPAILIVLMGLLLMHRGRPESAARRFFLYVLGVGLLLVIAIALLTNRSPEWNARPSYMLAELLFPSLAGLLVLIALNAGRLLSLGRRGRLFIAAGFLLVLGLFWAIWGDPNGYLQLILTAILPLVLIFFLGRRYAGLPVLLGLGTLVLLLLRPALETLFRNPPQWAAVPIYAIWMLVPVLPVALAASLIVGAARAMTETGGESPGGRNAGATALPRLLLALALLATYTYTIYWGSVWDQTSDGLTGIFYAMFGSVTAIAAGMVLTFILTGRWRVAGPLYAVLVPGLLFQAFHAGWDVSYHDLTERRAEGIAGALEGYRAREGHYPVALQELVPRDLLVIPQPVILKGESWCYQGESSAYRLGAFFREYFSTPVSLQVYAAAGEAPATPWPCEERLAEMKARYDWSGVGLVEATFSGPGAAATEPLPPSELPVARQGVIPIAEGQHIRAGGWAPDGSTFFFSQWEASDGLLRLGFLQPDTVRVCQQTVTLEQATEQHGQHVWLPGGRLFLMLAGEAFTIAPCSADLQPLAAPEPWQEIVARAPDNQALLLRGEGAFWMLDSGTLQARPVPEVTPNPYELHWDQAAWSPGGERLLISRLNGRDRRAGSTLYLVAPESGEVTGSWAIDEASDQSAPRVEWLSETEALLYGPEALVLYDFAVNPPARVDFLRDRLGLDLAFPGEVSSSASIVDAEGRGYYLALQLNHPRNQQLHLYHGPSGEVEIFDHGLDSFLIFPDGQAGPLTQLEWEPSYRDEYQVIWVDGSQEPAIVKIEGHTPRDYPTLTVRYLPDPPRLVASSEQGVSLTALPGGELLAFWEVAGSSYTYVLPSPDGWNLVAVVDRVGLYLISLDAQHGEGE
jgi:hypothetical protein